ncbi:MAG: hypothetical protein ACTS5P_01725 [Candidatus Hodgkinia cicadicola]
MAGRRWAGRGCERKSVVNLSDSHFAKLLLIWSEGVCKRSIAKLIWLSRDGPSVSEMPKGTKCVCWGESSKVPFVGTKRFTDGGSYLTEMFRWCVEVAWCHRNLKWTFRRGDDVF